MMASQRAAERQVSDARQPIAVDLDVRRADRQAPAARGAWPGTCAWRMLRLSISSRSAQPTAQRERARADERRQALALARRVSSFESARPRMRRRGSRITAAATTGPASGPAPGLIDAGDARRFSPRRAHRRPRSRAHAPSTQDGLGRALGAAAAQPAVDRREFRAAARARRAGSSSCCSSAAAERRAAHLLLEEFRHQRPSGEQVGLREVSHLDQPQRAQQERGQRRSTGRPPPSGGRVSSVSSVAVPEATSTTSAAASAALRLAVEQLNRGASRRTCALCARERLTSARRRPSARRSCTAGPRCGQHARGARRKSAPRRATSPRRLPGSSATTVRRGVQAERARARRARSSSQRNLVRQRVADELGAHAVLRVEVGLERQQAQHQIAGARRWCAPAPAARPTPGDSRTARS